MSGQAEAQEFLGALSPIAKVRDWYEDARATVLIEPNAMVVSTVDATGQPSSRVVLCKEFRDEGFVFYTNYLSKKGRDIEANPKVALNFFWDPLKHQVLVRGVTEKLSGAESDNYWNKRPRASQLAQYISQQSTPAGKRTDLELALKKAEERFADQPVPRPEHWGGYLVRPTYVEFWIGREMRFHDRFAYHKVESGWRGERLYP